MVLSINDINSAQANAFLRPSLIARGSVVAPGAGVTVAQLAIPTGLWELTIITSFGAVVGTFDGMEVFGLPTIATFTLPVTAVANGEPIPIKIKDSFSANSTNVIVRATTAGPVNSVYRAFILANKVLDWV